jgi:predicted DNA-binding protein (MmcQ/YjbR family)
MPRARPGGSPELTLRDAALAYPETHEDFPWPAHRAVKVRRKVFVILSSDEAGLSVSVKLPWSAEGALQFPCCEPTGYGLGRAGWVTASFGPREKVPVAVLRSWIDESYRAVAPRRLAAALAPGPRGAVWRAGRGARAGARVTPGRSPAPPTRRGSRPRASG